MIYNLKFYRGIFGEVGLILLCSSPILAITQYESDSYFDGSLIFVCFSMAVDLMPCIFFVGSIIIFFIIPLVILICVYALIARTLMSHPSQLVSLLSSIWTVLAKVTFLGVKSNEKRLSAKPKRHKVPQASDVDVGHCGHRIFHMPIPVSSSDSLDHLQPTGVKLPHGQVAKPSHQSR